MQSKSVSTVRIFRILLALLLAFIFWANVFRFSPQLIDDVYDATSEALVVAQLGRATVEGVFFKDSGLGINFDPKNSSGSRENYRNQAAYFANPETLQTGAGELKVVHFVKAPPKRDAGQQVDLWLAPGLEWYPVKIRFMEENGDSFEQLLEKVNRK